MGREYVFTFASSAGPEVVRWESAWEMMAYLSGFFRDRKASLLIRENGHEVRA